MREMDVVGVRVEMPANQPMLLLREVIGQRYLPVWIGAAEASAIANAQEGVLPPRPLTHDLMADVLASLGHRLTAVNIVKLEKGNFHATLVIDGTEISSRTSDAVALALRTGTDIFCTEEILDEAGIAVAEDENDEVERFREFLDHVSADDFVTGEEPNEDTGGGTGEEPGDDTDRESDQE